MLSSYFDSGHSASLQTNGHGATSVAIALLSYFATFIQLVSSTAGSGFLWKDYQNYTCDLSYAYEIQYELSLSQCLDSCSNTSSNCFGISWYPTFKNIANDPSRCYLLTTIYNLEESFTSSLSPITSFWYTNITQETCIDYPPSWNDKWGDNCDQYGSLNLCDNAFNNSAKAYILSDTDTQYGYNAFQVCCDCEGSLYNYNNLYLFESLWKPSNVESINNDMLCQSLDNYLKPHINTQLSLHELFGICTFLTRRAHHKHAIMYSLSSETNHDLQSVEMDEAEKVDDDSSSVASTVGHKRLSETKRKQRNIVGNCTDPHAIVHTN
eukprot:1069164_1